MRVRGCFGTHDVNKDEFWRVNENAELEKLGKACVNRLKRTGEMPTPFPGAVRDEDFITNSRVCEYAYIFNKETNMLEIYIGHQKKKPEGRFSDMPALRGYYACSLATEIHIDTINKYPANDVIRLMIEEVHDEQDRRR